MNLGNLINKKLIESKYENKKELHEAMKDIIGNNCCAYNTFTEILNKNKSLSDVELLTLSTLLDLDLNKLALHYVKSQTNSTDNLSVEQYFAKNKKSILLYATYICRNKYGTLNNSRYTLEICNKKIYYILQSPDSNSICCYEFDVKKGENGYVLRTNQIADFNYFDNVLEECDIDIDKFMELELDKKIEFLKREGIIYYDLFPENKQEIEDITLAEFENNLVNTVAQYCFNENKSDISRLEDDTLRDTEWAEYQPYLLENDIEEFAKNNNIYLNRLRELENEIFEIFKEIALENIPVFSEEQ